MEYTDFEGLVSKIQTIDGENLNFETLFNSLLELEDEEFEIIAPLVFSNYEKALNNPQDRIILAQTLNSTGIKLEEVIDLFEKFQTEIENNASISPAKKDFILKLINTLINTISESEGIAKRIIRIPVEISEEGKLPVYAHTTDSGMDIYATEDMEIKPGEIKLVKTGLKVALPIGYELQVRPRSGLSLKSHLRVSNSPGTIDAGYRDEIGIIIENNCAPIKDIEYEMSPDGNIKFIKSILYGDSYYIEKGDRIAQLVLMEVPKASLYKVDSVDKIGDNRNGGFGSSGK